MIVALFVLLIGAWLTQSFWVADLEHRGEGMKRFTYFLLCALASLLWPYVWAETLRELVLEHRVRLVDKLRNLIRSD